MFDYVVASVSPDIATEICDLILTPFTENQYRRLKEELIRRTATSQQQRIQQLLSTEDIGDRKPTQFLRRLQQLAGDAIPHDGVFLRELFLQRLPANVRIVLASTNDGTPITELAQQPTKSWRLLYPSCLRYLFSHQRNQALQKWSYYKENSSLLSKKLNIYSKLHGHNYYVVGHLAHADILRRNLPLTHRSRYAGIIKNLEPLQRNVDPPVRIRETTRPDTDGDWCPWP